MANKREKEASGFRPLGYLTERITHRLVRKRKLSGKMLARHWEEIIGADLAVHSAPERILRHGDEGVLVIRAEGGAGVEVQHMAGHILARIGEITGDRSLARIKVLHGPPAQKPMKAPAAKKPNHRMPQ